MTATLLPLRADLLATRLRELGIATPHQLEEAQQELASTQERFSAILTRRGVVRDADVGKRLALQLGTMPQRLTGPFMASPAASRVPAAMWRSHRLVPIQERKGTLLVATDDPFSVFSLEFFSRQCGCSMEAILVMEQDLAPILEEPTPSPAALAPPPVTSRPQAPPIQVAPPAPAPTAASHVTAAARQTPDQQGEEPIITLVDSMLSEAVRRRASDIHLEPGRDGLRLRYRIDGVLQDVNSPPKALHGSIVSRIKIMGGLNIAEKRLPQDGRLQLSVEQRPLDVRISLLPSMHGEAIVMRLLDRSQPIRGLPEMGLPPEDQRAWEELIHRPHGMSLVTGPTGSGKTTTLYGALAMLNRPDRKLITIEDPVEYQLTGVNQVSVKAAIGLTFAAGLRSMLRQAPDVIMVGEIRDRETAQVAVQAALTGHLVLSTLHTNDAPSTVTRLIDMGIAPFLVASTLQGVLAQRLVRRVCPHCRIMDHATPEERAFLGAPEIAQVIRSNGCDRCHGSGYIGRIGLFELLVMTEPIRTLIVDKAGAAVIRAAALKQGMRSLVDDGRLKVREGTTTMSEVLRVAYE